MVKCRVVHKELIDYGNRRNERLLIDCEPDGEVVADIDPDRCWIRWYEATPKRRGYGTAAVATVESRLQEHGCKLLALMPGNGGDEDFWRVNGYSWGTDAKGFRMMVKKVGPTVISGPIKLRPWKK